MSRRPMLALLLVGSVLAWTVHRAMQKAKRKAQQITPRRPVYHTDQWDADEIHAHRTTSLGLLCPDYFVTFPVQTGSDVAQVPDSDIPES